MVRRRCSATGPPRLDGHAPLVTGQALQPTSRRSSTSYTKASRRLSRSKAAHGMQVADPRGLGPLIIWIPAADRQTERNGMCLLLLDRRQTRTTWSARGTSTLRCAAPSPAGPALALRMVDDQHGAHYGLNDLGRHRARLPRGTWWTWPIPRYMRVTRTLRGRAAGSLRTGAYSARIVAHSPTAQSVLGARTLPWRPFALPATARRARVHRDGSGSRSSRARDAGRAISEATPSPSPARDLLKIAVVPPQERQSRYRQPASGLLKASAAPRVPRLTFAHTSHNIVRHRHERL